MNRPNDFLATLADPPQENCLYTYFEPGTPDVDEDVILRFVENAHRCGISCIIPRLCETAEDDSSVLDAMKKTYRTLLHAARGYGIRVAFNIEKIIETTVVRWAEAEGVFLRAQVLDRYEYFCNQTRTEKIALHKGGLRLAIIAVNKEHEELIDLRANVKDDQLVWEVPFGNWTVEEYFCDGDREPNVNYLDYALCRDYLSRAYALFADVLDGPDREAVGVLHYADICFHAVNRRNWTARFNEECAARYGFDPAPLYPHLYSYINPDTPNVKAILFCCRAALLQGGICRALADFAAEHHMELLSTLTEPKLSACSWITGDALLDNAFAPGALLDRSYLYGVNSLKIAAGGAYNFDRPRVSCELYRDYYQISLPIIYKDAINAFGRGANLVMAHTQHFQRVTDDRIADGDRSPWLGRFADFVARSQTLLRGGRHVSDIAVLYPIHSLHANVNFYSAPAHGFEYPVTPETVDYATLINSISFYAGHDVTLLHPDVLAEKCSVRGNELCLDNKTNPERFRVIVLPSAALVRLDTLLRVREFYEAGGKLIVTGDLPGRAFEWKPDESHNAEIRENLLAIFGEDALNPAILENVRHVRNENGGEAYLLYQTQTATDGTMMVSCVTLAQILDSFGLPFDISLPTMPRFICTGALNNPYPEFETLGLHRAIPGGGMLNHIHKRRDDLGIDVFFFGNTSDRPFCGEALLRGKYELTEYDPHTGRSRSLPVTYTEQNGAVYTRLWLEVASVEAKFLLGAQK